MLIHLNGALVPASQARIDPADRGFTLGDGLFETMLAMGGRVRRLEAHLARLRAGAAVLGIPVPLDDARLAEALIQVMTANALTDAALRLTLTRGVAPRGLLPPAEAMPTLLITAAPPPPPALPARAILASVTRRNQHSPMARIKSLNYGDNLLARMEAAARGADEAILLNTENRLAEATIANLFVVVNGEVLTPPVEDGALPGVMRAVVLAASRGRETPLSAADVAGASEAFLTNSLGIRPLIMLDGSPIGSGQPGPVAAAISQCLTEN